MRRLFWCMCLILCAGLVNSATANPIPAESIWFHVHEWTGDFCQSSTIDACEEIVQVSTVSGDVEIDAFPLFLFPEPVSVFRIDVAWPEGWTFQGFESCEGGVVTILPLGERSSRVQIDWAPAYPAEVGLDLIGRFRFWVDRAGELTFTEAGWNGMWAFTSTACAARGDCYCYWGCDYRKACGADFWDAVVEMSANPGASTEATAGAWVRSVDRFDSAPCPVEFVSDASWLTVADTRPHPYEAALVLTADATGLSPGVYEGRIRASSDCQTCLPVTLTVGPALGVPGDGYKLGSWGRVKSAYR